MSQQKRTGRFSIIFSSALGAIAILGIPLILGGLVIYQDEADAKSILRELPEAFILANYLNLALAVTYSALINARKMKGRWWINLLLIPVMFLGTFLIAMLILSRFIELPRVEPSNSQVFGLGSRIAFLGFVCSGIWFSLKAKSEAKADTESVT